MKQKKQKKPTPSLSLAQLKKEWYAKLKKSGFDDIEVHEQKLKSWTSVGSHNPYNKAYKYKEMGFDAKADYYRLATHFLNEHKFKNKFEAAVWEYHTNGISIRNIVSTLEKVALHKHRVIDRSTIHRLVKELRAIMFRLYQVHSGKTNEQ